MRGTLQMRRGPSALWPTVLLLVTLQHLGASFACHRYAALTLVCTLALCAELCSRQDNAWRASAGRGGGCEGAHSESQSPNM